MASLLRLADLPSNLSSRYLPYIPSLRQKQRAIAFVKGSYIKKMLISRSKDEDPIDVSCRVYRSQRKSEEPHKTSLQIDVKNEQILDAWCSCKAGMGGRCAHVLAVIMVAEEWKIAGYDDVPSEPSSTSLPQQWDRPRGPKIQPEAVSQLIISRPGNIDRKRRPVMACFNDNRKIQVSEQDVADLKLLTNSPISYLLSHDTPTTTTPIGPQHIGSPLAYHAPLINPIATPVHNYSGCGDIIFPKQHHLDLDLENIKTFHHHWEELQTEKAIDIERQTREDVELWFKERKHRITASNFGSIMNRKKEFNVSFIKNTFEKGNFVSKPTSYGKSCETVAKQMYINKTGRHIHGIGLVINPVFPFLGATPDAVVCDQGDSGIIEIKCPYSVRDMTISEACQRRRDFFLFANGDHFELLKDHPHWYQVQGQLLVTGSPFCDFVLRLLDKISTSREFYQMLGPCSLF